MNVDFGALRDCQAEISRVLRQAIETKWSRREDEIVEALVSAITGSKPFSFPGAGVTIVPEAAFLHGHRSQVKFSVAGGSYQRELADLVILASVAKGTNLVRQRVCFVQAKKETRSKGLVAARYSLDRWQLALLRSFPEFTGVSGVFPKVPTNLRQVTGMLGAYGLLSAPGEFSLLSAQLLHQLVAGRKSIRSADFAPIFAAERPIYSNDWWWVVHPDDGPWSGRSWYSVSSAPAIERFVGAWMSMALGEPWESASTAAGGIALRQAVRHIASNLQQAPTKTGNLTQLVSLDWGDNAQGDAPVAGGLSGGDGHGAVGVLSLIIRF